MFPDQILAIWGSPSCGKTAASIKLAKELSNKKKNVIVVLCDILCPSLPVLLPLRDNGGKSLGLLLGSCEVTQEKILTSCVTLGNEYICLLGYEKGENAFTNAAYTKEKAVDLLVLLRHLADFIIIDCSSNIAFDILSAAALEAADKVLRFGSCDLKGVTYFYSQLPMLSDRKFNSGRHIKVLSNVKAYEPKAVIKEFYKGVGFELPYTAEVTEQYLSGGLFECMKSKEGKAFEKVIGEIIRGCLRYE